MTAHPAGVSLDLGGGSRGTQGRTGPVPTRVPWDLQCVWCVYCVMCVWCVWCNVCMVWGCYVSCLWMFCLAACSIYYIIHAEQEVMEITTKMLLRRFSDKDLWAQKLHKLTFVWVNLVCVSSVYFGCVFCVRIWLVLCMCCMCFVCIFCVCFSVFFLHNWCVLCVCVLCAYLVCAMYVYSVCVFVV